LSVVGLSIRLSVKFYILNVCSPELLANFDQTWHNLLLGKGFKSVEIKGSTLRQGWITAKEQNTLILFSEQPGGQF
jgi:hypothetical protein